MPLTPEVLLRPKKFNYFNIGAYLGPGEDIEEQRQQREKAVVFFQHVGMLATDTSIVYCECGLEFSCRKDKNRGILGFRWYCSNCEKRISPMNDTFFADTRLGDLATFGISTVMKLSACWYFRMPVGRAALHCEVLKRTAIKWYGFFREAVIIAEGHDFKMIGGQDDIVEVDESRPHKRKGRHGRLSSMQTQDAWIFGGISRKDGRRFAVWTVRRNRETLFAFIRTYVQPGSFIMSDCWAAYDNVSQLCGMSGHAAVNHSETYVLPDRLVIDGIEPELGIPDVGGVSVQVHSNRVERMWRDLKSYLPPGRRDEHRINEYIREYMYRKNILERISPYAGGRIQKLFQDIQRVYPGPNRNPIQDKRTFGPNQHCTCPECI